MGITKRTFQGKDLQQNGKARRSEHSPLKISKNVVLTGPGRTRTYDKWIMSSLPENAKHPQTQRLTNRDTNHGAQKLRFGDELGQIIATWPMLSEQAKANDQR